TPVIIHESDITPGLANKLALPFAHRICYAFAETGKHLPPGKAVQTGIPVRTELLSGDAEKGRNICGLSAEKPVLLVIGGSQGSQAINLAIRQGLSRLLKAYQVCHLCGRGNLDPALNGTPGYAQYEYVSDDLAHFFASSDLVLSRAGATTLFELLALKKPALLIPLSARVSRGDQILNAESFRQAGYSLVLSEEALTPEALLTSITELQAQADEMKTRMSAGSGKDAIAGILQIIQNAHQ
ncbi:MAG: glycosyltransferase, partial [bacterium]|nr:glycosyltransferase [bacterium]